MRHRRISKETAYVGARAPQVVRDHLAAAQVLDLEAEVSVSAICLHQRGVGVGSQVLKSETRLNSHVAAKCCCQNKNSI